MTEAREEFVSRIAACRSEIVNASSELDAIEGHGPGGESAISAALAALDAAIQAQELSHRKHSNRSISFQPLLARSG